jgi:hypothetical protein
MTDRDKIGQRGGQVMIFLIMALLILSFVAFWNFDLHKIVYVKSLSQNAGDAAALSGARWQGITLNLIGDLNIMQAVALTQGDTNTATDINDMQARLCYVGPMVGLMAAQQAAKNNGVFNHDGFTERMRRHADVVRFDYPALGPDGRMLFQEPYSNCWQEYADMIQVVADNGVAAAPDNARLYSDFTGGHLLLNVSFYDAIAGEEWCWFFHNAYEVLLNYTDYHYWPPLPEELPQADPMNSEYFGLGLAKQELIGDASVVALMNDLREDRQLSDQVITDAVANVSAVWYSYEGGTWGPWDAMSPGGEVRFPVTGPVKPQYDYAGADAATRVVAQASRLTPGSAPSTITWTAAAKPFGYLEEDERPTVCGLVLPAFRDVRLIPIDASSAPAGGAFDLDWREHIEGHLRDYLRDGLPGLNPYCWYCQQLVTWEDAVFRQTGIDWLRDFSSTCHTHGGPGGRGGGGGRRRGH